MMISLDKTFKLIINLDLRNINSLCLISYANDYANRLSFTDDKRNGMINAMVMSEDFDQVLTIFKYYFGDYVEIYYKLKKFEK